jgi:hypothetical protein
MKERQDAMALAEIRERGWDIEETTVGSSSGPVSGLKATRRTATLSGVSARRLLERIEIYEQSWRKQT